MTELFQNIIEITNVMVEMILIFLYFSLLSERKHHSRCPVLSAYILSVVALSATVLLKAEALVLLFVSIGILFAIAMLIYAEPVRNKVLWVFIYVLIITIAEPLMIGILCLANMGVPTDFLAPGVARYLGMIGTKIIYLWLIALAHRILKSRVKDLPLKYWALILVIPVTSVFILQLMLDHITAEGTIINYVSCGMALAGILYINISMFHFFESYEDKIKIKYLERLKQQEQENYRMLTLTHKQMREFKHDISNQFSVLNSLLEQEKTDDARIYLSKLGSFVKSANSICYTGNHAVDSLVNIKAALAKSLGIDFICKINVITEIRADEMTLCRIIGNALDNAIEGCGRSGLPQKHICFSFNENNDKIIMLITNSSDEVNIDDMVSTKKEKGVHGIGTESIRSAVESLNGIVDFNYDEGVFKLTLMVMNQSLI